jgi:phage regulator Rha-like protein
VVQQQLQAQGLVVLDLLLCMAMWNNMQHAANRIKLKFALTTRWHKQLHQRSHGKPHQAAQAASQSTVHAKLSATHQVLASDHGFF